MKKLVSVVTGFLGLLLLAGCNSPGYRISKNQDLFDSFPPDVQENVRQSKVDIGYTKDMVLIAFGKPDREYTRLTAAGVSEVWSYTRVELRGNRQRVDGTFNVRDSSGRFRTVHDSVWVDVNTEHEYETRRVEFQDGLVKAVEEIKL